MKKMRLAILCYCIITITGTLAACESADKNKGAECVYQTQADLTHNGMDETVEVMVYPKSTEYPDGLYQISVYNAQGKVLWSEEREGTHVETGAYYLVNQEEYYLLYYRPDIVAGMGDYAYRLFYLEEDGSETERDAGTLTFTATNEEGVTRTFSGEELIAFAEKANGYLAKAYLLLDTSTFPVHYSTQENLVTYEEKYQLLMTSAGISDTGDMEGNVKAYYEYLYSENAETE